MRAEMTSEVTNLAKKLVISDADLDSSASRTECTLAALDNDCLTKVFDCFTLETRCDDIYNIITHKIAVCLHPSATEHSARAVLGA